MTAPSGFGLRDTLIATAINVMWGFNLIATKMAVLATKPLTAGALRLLIVIVVCSPYLRRVPGRMGLVMLFAFINGALFLIVMTLALSVSRNVGALAIGGQLGIPFSLLLGIVFLGERLSRRQVIGTLLAFAGVVVLVFDPVVVDEWRGLALMTLGALIWAVSNLIQRRLAGVSVMTMFAWNGVVGAAVLIPLSLILEMDAVLLVPEIPASAFAWIAFSALGSTVVGQGAMAWLLQRHPVSSVMPLGLAAPVVAVLASSAIFDTAITSLMMLGGVMAIGGVGLLTITRRQVPVEAAGL